MNNHDFKFGKRRLGDKLITTWVINVSGNTTVPPYVYTLKDLHTINITQIHVFEIHGKSDCTVTYERGSKNHLVFKYKNDVNQNFEYHIEAYGKH